MATKAVVVDMALLLRLSAHSQGMTKTVNGVMCCWRTGTEPLVRGRGRYRGACLHR